MQLERACGAPDGEGMGDGVTFDSMFCLGPKGLDPLVDLFRDIHELSFSKKRLPWRMSDFHRVIRVVNPYAVALKTIATVFMTRLNQKDRHPEGPALDELLGKNVRKSPEPRDDCPGGTPPHSPPSFHGANTPDADEQFPGTQGPAEQLPERGETDHSGFRTTPTPKKTHAESPSQVHTPLQTPPDEQTLRSPEPEQGAASPASGKTHVDDYSTEPTAASSNQTPGEKTEAACPTGTEANTGGGSPPMETDAPEGTPPAHKSEEKTGGKSKPQDAPADFSTNASPREGAYQAYPEGGNQSPGRQPRKRRPPTDAGAIPRDNEQPAYSGPTDSEEGSVS